MKDTVTDEEICVGVALNHLHEQGDPLKSVQVENLQQCLSLDLWFIPVCTVLFIDPYEEQEVCFSDAF